MPFGLTIGRSRISVVNSTSWCKELSDMAACPTPNDIQRIAYPFKYVNIFYCSGSRFFCHHLKEAILL